MIRAYIGQELRSDLERFEGDQIHALIASLKRQGVSEEVIQKTLEDIA